MAIVTGGGWSSETPSGRGELVTKITRLYGVENDDELRDIALSFLDEAIKDMNSRLYEFMRVFVEGITLVAEQRNYELPVGFYRESLAYLVKSDGNTEPPLVYLPWTHFQRMWGTTSITRPDQPVAYSLQNVHEYGEVHLAPAPNGSIADQYTLTLEYYRRIPLLSPPNAERLDVPQEVETALLFAAQKRMAIHIYGPSHPDVAAFDALEQRALARLKRADARHPDQQKRFRLADHYSNRRLTRRGAFYIRLD